MATLIAYTSKHPDTLRSAPPDAEWRYVGVSDHDYWRVLGEFWARGEELTTIEHDIVCRPDILDGFASCPQPWCLHSYSNHDAAQAEAWRSALGCTRFRKELVRAVPDAVSSIPEQFRDWRDVCSHIGANIRAAGFTHHWHHPPVVHHRMQLGHLTIGG